MAKITSEPEVAYETIAKAEPEEFYEAQYSDIVTKLENSEDALFAKELELLKEKQLLDEELLGKIDDESKLVECILGGK